MAPAGTNYAGRCLDEGFSKSPVCVNLPVTVFLPDAEKDQAPGRYVYMQSEEAMMIAREHGFRNVTERVAAGKPRRHAPPGSAVRIVTTWCDPRAKPHQLSRQ